MPKTNDMNKTAIVFNDDVTQLTILAGLLLPALQEAVTAARRIACANNLKQVALGTTLYIGDFDDYVPLICTVPIRDGSLCNSYGDVHTGKILLDDYFED